MHNLNDNTPKRQCTKNEHCLHPEAQDGWLPATLDYFNKYRGGLSNWCKACLKEYGRLYRLNNLEKEQARGRRYYQNHRNEMLEKHRVYREEHRQESRNYFHTLYWNNQERERERKRLYRQLHPDRVRELSKAQYQKHIVKLRIRHKLYDHEHRDKVRETSRLFYEQHHEEIAEHGRRDRLLNPEKYRLKNRIYHLNHPEVRRAAKHRWRARITSAKGDHTASDIRLQIKTQTDKRGRLHCWWCSDVIDGDNYHVDHRIPLAKGGGNTPENLCIACPHCNLSKGAKLPQEWNGRLL